MVKNLNIIKDLNLQNPSPRDKFLSFMFGVDDAIEREILRYVYESHKVVNLNQLIIKFVYKEEYCSIRRLYTHLDSLVKFKFLLKSNYRGTTFYEIPPGDLNVKEV